MLNRTSRRESELEKTKPLQIAWGGEGGGRDGAVGPQKRKTRKEQEKKAWEKNADETKDEEGEEENERKGLIVNNKATSNITNNLRMTKLSSKNKNKSLG